MKNTQIKMILGCLILTCLTLNLFGQSTADLKNKKLTKIEAKLERSKVPVLLSETFIKEYPTGMYEEWYGYPEYTTFGYEPSYYYYNENPENYIVEFTQDNVKHRTFYNKTGKKIATHSVIASVPKMVEESIAKGEYKTWTQTEEKEEILKDGDSDILKVYKVEVMKGNQKHALFYGMDGKLMKDVEMKM